LRSGGLETALSTQLDPEDLREVMREYHDCCTRVVEELLARSTRDLQQDAALLADLLSIPAGDRYPTLALSPQRRRQKTLDALTAQLAELSAHQDVLQFGRRRSVV
jgi:hypothetical protein